ncbi:MAG TPA: hypothetical protein DCL75_18800 [Ktedonobacter sp.]|nr:hypothetical protein [Ktedonobacter sp.]
MVRLVEQSLFLYARLRAPKTKADEPSKYASQNSGIGIPKDALPRLFERFYRGSNIDGNKTRGIGLGLYIVAELLRMHDGTIRAESTGIPGEGSRFIITLPSSPIEKELVDSA